MRYILSTFLLLICFQFSLKAQTTVDTLPSAFMIGEHEKAYSQMLTQQPELLMTVCNGNMDQAYANWLNFLRAVEQFAIENEVDINGVKIWINVFWSPNGRIKHIAFFPKPNSKNMDYEYVRVLFSQFIMKYETELKYEKLFCHYGSASFPSFITTSGNIDK